MELKRKSILLIMVFLIGCDLCACGKKDSVAGESLVEDTEEVSSTEETKSAEEELDGSDVESIEDKELEEDVEAEENPGYIKMDFSLETPEERNQKDESENTLCRRSFRHRDFRSSKL